jgi:dTDP-4-dehydrorhamnose 3,5-epimerase
VGCQLKVLQRYFKDAFVIELEPFVDYRGMFARIFCQNEMEQIGVRKSIKQINHSLTLKKGAVRGMHFQFPPKSEIKIVRCLQGSVFDVMIDLRSGSDTFLGWHGEILSVKNQRMTVIPEGFAHGFQTLEENSELLYLHTEFYSPKHESGIRFDDSMINISWPLEVTDVSEKDRKYPLLAEDFKGIQL